MSSPVRVACDALRSDATKWAQAATALDSAAKAAQGLSMGVAELGFAAQEHGVVAAYEALRQKLVRLLTSGVTELDGLAALLRQAADTYQSEDEAGAHRVAEAGVDQ